ncbi:hypothetical protein MMC12_001372 [Toensbergia leucococca]|nr:hypothetical protein [Toensbergia leucococca]
MTSSEPGGFLHPDSTNLQPLSTTSLPNAISLLPQPRLRPLKSGGSKESSFIEYVDRKVLEISRRYEKRYNADLEDKTTPGFEVSGYENFGEVATDLEGVLDVVWMSGTPSLQIPYLLTIALNTCTYLSSFSFLPRPTFQLLSKLDVAFSSLLQGRNVESGQNLPGFEGGRGKLSTTEKVRIRGIVERTRLAVVEVSGRDESIDGVSRIAESQTDTDEGPSMDEDDELSQGNEHDGSHGRWEMEIARAYERTIVDLGASFDTSSIGSSG